MQISKNCEVPSLCFLEYIQNGAEGGGLEERRIRYLNIFSGNSPRYRVFFCFWVVCFVSLSLSLPLPLPFPSLNKQTNKRTEKQGKPKKTKQNKTNQTANGFRPQVGDKTKQTQQ